MRALIKINIRDLKGVLHSHRADHRTVRLTPYEARAWERKCHGLYERMLRICWRRTLSGAYIVRTEYETPPQEFTPCE